MIFTLCAEQTTKDSPTFVKYNKKRSLFKQLDDRGSYQDLSIREWLWDIITRIEKQVQKKSISFQCSKKEFLILKYLFTSLKFDIKLLKNDGVSLLKIKKNNQIISRAKKSIMYGGIFLPFLIDNKKKKVKAKAVFYPSKQLPKNISISTPLTFAEKDTSIVLTYDKQKWWNPLGGHMEKGETWQDATKRESYEEAGVIIDNLKVFGYIKITRIKANGAKKYPRISQIPMTTSKVIQFSKNWKPMETSERKVFNDKKTFQMLKIRHDGGQMVQIYSYLKFLKKYRLI